MIESISNTPQREFDIVNKTYTVLLAIEGSWRMREVLPTFKVKTYLLYMFKKKISTSERGETRPHNYIHLTKTIWTQIVRNGRNRLDS